MLSAGIQRTLARVSSASATHTLACAAATTSGLASESRRAVARLIGKQTSVGSRGAGFSFKSVARGLGRLVATLSPSGTRGGSVGGRAGGWAAHGAGSTPQRNKAVTRIHAQADRSIVSHLDD